MLIRNRVIEFKVKILLLFIWQEELFNNDLPKQSRCQKSSKPKSSISSMFSSEAHDRPCTRNCSKTRSHLLRNCLNCRISRQNRRILWNWMCCMTALRGPTRIRLRFGSSLRRFGCCSRIGPGLWTSRADGIPFGRWVGCRKTRK